MQKFFSLKFLLSCATFLILCFLYWNRSFFYFQFDFVFFYIYILNIIYGFGIDALSIFFVILCCFLLCICLLICWYWSYELELYLYNILFVFYILVNLFFVKDFLFLFFFFELVTLPLFLFIGVWGSRDRKVYASYLLMFYTLLGSIFAFFGFIILSSNIGSTSLLDLVNITYNIDRTIQVFLFSLILLGFSVKVPVIPIHIWLPEAHVEAPTVGSVILAGIVLKLGFYLYLRVLLFSFLVVLPYFISFIFVLCSLGFYISSFAALAQIDVKKIIAYSSISHMNFSLIGLFAGNLISMVGSFFMMFGHAIVASSLFSSVGLLYDRYKTRLLFYYGGLVLLMPVWSIFFFIFILSNFSLPGTMNFVGEFIIFLGSFIASNFIMLSCFFGLFLTMMYSLFLYARIVNGMIKEAFIRFFGDLSRREVFLFLPLLLIIIFFGLNPNLFLDYYFLNVYYYFINFF